MMIVNIGTLFAIIALTLVLVVAWLAIFGAVYSHSLQWIVQPVTRSGDHGGTLWPAAVRLQTRVLITAQLVLAAVFALNFAIAATLLTVLLAILTGLRASALARYFGPMAADLPLERSVALDSDAAAAAAARRRRRRRRRGGGRRARRLRRRACGVHRVGRRIRRAAAARRRLAGVPPRARRARLSDSLLTGREIPAASALIIVSTVYRYPRHTLIHPLARRPAAAASFGRPLLVRAPHSACSAPPYSPSCSARPPPV